MSNPAPQRRYQCKAHGFRLSRMDVGVIVSVIVLTVVARPWLGEMSWLFAIVAGHFFLFCNVFRIHRKYELVWSGLFVINVSTLCVIGAVDWGLVLAAQSPITALFIVLSFVQRDYHGVLWRYAPNPRAPRSIENQAEGV